MHRGILIGLVAPAAILAGILLFVWYMDSSMEPIESSDRAQIKAIMAQWPLPEITGHFPKTIHWQATEVKAKLDPGGMQGAARLQLQMVLPQEQFDAVLDEHGQGPASKTQAAVSQRVDIDAVSLLLVEVPGKGLTGVQRGQQVLMLKGQERGSGSWHQGRIAAVVAEPGVRRVYYVAQVW